MSRIWTTGFEIFVAASVNIDILQGGSGTITRDTTSQRTGAGCLKCDSTGSNTAAYMTVYPSGLPTSTTLYMRAYFRFQDLPASAVELMTSGSTVASARLTSGGKLQLWTTAQQGSDSTATISTGSTYYRIELMFVINASTQITSMELRLDGATVATATGLAITVSKSVFTIGWATAPGASKVCYVDDVAVNSNAGATNNSWPGDGRVVALLPTADSAVGSGWTLGTGTAISGNAFGALDNIPQTGVADLQAGSDVQQVRNAAAAASSNLELTMQTYTAAGITAGATINAVFPFVATAAPVATSAKLGTIGLVSNPAVADIALASGGTTGAFWNGTVAGAFPTGWKWSRGTSTDAPSVTLGTAPVLRVGQTTSSTRIAMACFAGVYVDYTPAAAAAAIPDVGMALTVT